MMRELEHSKRMVWLFAFMSVAVVITAPLEIHHHVYSAVNEFSPSTLQVSPYNGTVPSVLANYTNANNNTPVTDPPVVYFPFQLKDNPQIRVALIPHRPNLSLSNSVTGIWWPFGLDCGIALLNENQTQASRTAFSINSVTAGCNNASYNGSVFIIKKISDASPPDMVLDWGFGYAFHIVALLLNSSGGYLTRMAPGVYSVFLNISLYSLHTFYRTCLGCITMSMPWAIVMNNYTGPSFEITVGGYRPWAYGYGNP